MMIAYVDTLMNSGFCNDILMIVQDSGLDVCNEYIPYLYLT